MPLLAWIVAGKVAAATGLEAVAGGFFDDEHPPSAVAATAAPRRAKDQNRALTLHLLSVEERPRSTGGGWPSDTRTPSSRAFVVLSGRRPGSVRDDGPHSCGTAPESHRLRCRQGWRECSTAERDRARLWRGEAPAGRSAGGGRLVSGQRSGSAAPFEWRRGRVVRQRSAKPRTAVQFCPPPLWGVPEREGPVFMKLFGGGPYGGSNTCFYP